MAIETDSDPAEDVLAIVMSADGSVLGHTSDRGLLESWKVVRADFLLNVLADTLQSIVLGFQQIAKLRGEVVKDRACPRVLLEKGSVRWRKHECVVVASEVNQGLLEQHLGSDAVGDVDPYDRTGGDGSKDLLALDDQAVLDELCDHGQLELLISSVFESWYQRTYSAESLSDLQQTHEIRKQGVNTLVVEGNRLVDKDTQQSVIVGKERRTDTRVVLILMHQTVLLQGTTTLINRNTSEGRIDKSLGILVKVLENEKVADTSKLSFA